MKSNKQRRKELKEARSLRAKKKRQARQNWLKPIPSGAIAVDPSQLAPTSSYSPLPEFYVDQPFTCRDCGAEEVWTAQQQQWWCEVAKGCIWSTAIRCRSCRKIERDRKAEARRVHLEGIARKQAQQQSQNELPQGQG